MNKNLNNVFFHIGRIKDGDVDGNNILYDLTKAEAIEFCQHNQLGTYKVAYSIHCAKDMVDYNNRNSNGILISYDKRDIFILKYVVQIAFNQLKSDFECEDLLHPLNWFEPELWQKSTFFNYVVSKIKLK